LLTVDITHVRKIGNMPSRDMQRVYELLKHITTPL